MFSKRMRHYHHNKRPVKIFNESITCANETKHRNFTIDWN
jgi:hypothetical protein